MIRHAFTRTSAALLLAFAVFGSACTLGVSENEAGAGSTFIGSLELIDPADREPAPDVCGTTTADEDLCLDTFVGTPTLVNFWASWCGPCAREIPELVELDSTREDLHIVGVNVQDSIVNARSFERDQGVTYPSWFDEGSIIAGAFGGIAPEALPSTILLDREHRVAIRLFGAVTMADLVPFLDQLSSETG